MIAARIRNAATHLTEIDGWERAYHDYDERSYALHRKIILLVAELRAIADAADAPDKAWKLRNREPDPEWSSAHAG